MLCYVILPTTTGPVLLSASSRYGAKRRGGSFPVRLQFAAYVSRMLPERVPTKDFADTAEVLDGRVSEPE